MTGEDLDLLNDEEDVIIEGSELHQALTNMGYTNFHLTPKVKIEHIPHESDLPINYKTWSRSFNNKISSIRRFFWQEGDLRKKQLKIILNENILLDDHAAMVYELLDDQNTSKYRKFVEWLPVVGSTAAMLALAIKKQNIPSALGALTVFGSSIYVKFNHWIAARHLKNLVILQIELHNLIKHSLKVLRRHCKNSVISELHEKNELIGSEKYSVVLEIKKLLTEVFENLSRFYYQQGNEILNILPSSLRSKCILTKIDTENEEHGENDYNKLKRLYNTYILAQSEMMFVLANAYNGTVEDTYFKIPNNKLLQVIQKFNNALTIYFLELSKVMQTYNMCEIQPIKRVFRGTSSSKWQDVYVHLDLTSHRIQLAYKEIMKILELIDADSEKDENDLIEPITEKMNEAYKQLENARSFAEFSSLLIAKAQRKHITNSETENENENLFPVNGDNRTVVMVDEELEIEDEVFEEYIKEEYLKPMYENSDGSIIDNYKLDKLLKKNFMSELKDALIDKQKSMTERELRALKRMYDRVKRDSCINKVPETAIDDSTAVPPSVPPPPPPVPPPILENKIVAENNVEEDDEEEPRKGRTPVPLPRVKMLQADDEIPYVQKFSLSECTPNFKFPQFKAVEETFLGSGENSEEEANENSDSSENEEVEN